MKISVKAFGNNQQIPEKYTCDGENISPEISISGIPEKKYYMIILNDPDAPVGLFTHWIIYNIPSSISQLHENMEKLPITDENFYQGKNDFGKIGYGGPCPPQGNGVHRYFFNLYIQDKKIENEKINVNDAYTIVRNRDKAIYMGTYIRH